MKMIQTRVKKNKDKPPKHNFEAKKKKIKLQNNIYIMFKNIQTIFYPLFLVKI